MQKTLRCPGCDAELTLTASDAAHGQCPRCRCAFDLTRSSGVTSLTADAPLPTPRRATAPSLDDDLPDDLRTLVRPDPLTGEWKAYLAISTLALSMLAYGLQFGVRHVLPAHEATVMLQLMYWPAVIGILIWVHQASRNLKLLRAAALSHTPGIAVISFLVPIYNLYRGYFIMQEIWRGSDPRATASSLAWIDAPRSELIRVWWFLFLSAQGLAFLSPHRGDSWMMSVSHLGMILAGGLLIVIILTITLRQRERYERLYADAMICS